MTKKFRIWDKTQNKFTNPTVVYTDGKWYSFGHVYLLEEKGLVMQQWTGLLDKNGCEIYEGDIVKIGEEWVTHIPLERDAIEVWSCPSDAHSGWCWRGLIGKILFDSGCFTTYPVNNRDVHFFPTYERNCKVIGNIFENPLDNSSTKD